MKSLYFLWLMIFVILLTGCILGVQDQDADMAVAIGVAHLQAPPTPALVIYAVV